MAEVTLAIGAAAVCRDGFAGKLKALVVDPRARAVTHLVIEPHGGRGLARLVPLDHADAAAEPVSLDYTEAQIREMETVPLIPDAEAEAETSRGDHVHATDGNVGQFHGLRVDPGSGDVRSVLVKPHPWGHAELAIAIGDVSGFDAGIQLSITRQDAKNLAS